MINNNDGYTLIDLNVSLIIGAIVVTIIMSSIIFLNSQLKYVFLIWNKNQSELLLNKEIRFIFSKTNRIESFDKNSWKLYSNVEEYVLANDESGIKVNGIIVYPYNNIVIDTLFIYENTYEAHLFRIDKVDTSEIVIFEKTSL